jgi:hypothetical protein
MPLYIYIAIFLFVCLLLGDRLWRRMVDALADAVWGVLGLCVLLLLYYLFVYPR